jgi:hypothetical protein
MSVTPILVSSRREELPQPTILFHDTTDGTFPSARDVYVRFLISAEDVDAPVEWVRELWLQATVKGDDAARELIENTCGVEFL